MGVTILTPGNCSTKQNAPGHKARGILFQRKGFAVKLEWPFSKERVLRESSVLPANY